MLVVGIIFSVGLLGVIIYFAVSPKSSKQLRLAAIIALGVISVSLVVCGIMIIRGPGEDPTAVHLPVFQDSAPQAKRKIPVMDLAIISAFLLAMGLIIVKALRDQKKAPKAAPKTRENLDFPEDDHKQGGLTGADGEDSFDLDDLDLK